MAQWPSHVPQRYPDRTSSLPKVESGLEKYLLSGKQSDTWVRKDEYFPPCQCTGSTPDFKSVVGRIFSRHWCFQFSMSTPVRDRSVTLTSPLLGLSVPVTEGLRMWDHPFCRTFVDRLSLINVNFTRGTSCLVTTQNITLDYPSLSFSIRTVTFV